MWKFKDLYESVQKRLLDKSADKWKTLYQQDPSSILNWTPDGQPERNFWNLKPADEIVNETCTNAPPDNGFERHFIDEQKRLLSLKWLDKMEEDVFKKIGWKELNPCAEVELPTFKWIQEPDYSMVDEHGDVDVPKVRYTKITPPHYASCDKCDPKNILFYDTKVYDSCPRCKELRMEPDEFLKESEMIL